MLSMLSVCGLMLGMFLDDRLMSLLCAEEIHCLSDLGGCCCPNQSYFEQQLYTVQ